MAELVYSPVVFTCKAMFRILDLKLDVRGSEHIPRRGGAVIACTHQSYLDFIFCGLGALPSKRLVRFMAKQEVFANRVAGPLLRGMRHIPVDRAAGRDSYDEAVRRLRGGEVVGVFPEATISRSFTVKDLKSGAARMAADAGVPLIPMAVWGPQRLWTKGPPEEPHPTPRPGRDPGRRTDHPRRADLAHRSDDAAALADAGPARHRASAIPGHAA